METRERNSLNYNNNPPQSNQDSSPRLTSANETLNDHLHLHQCNNSYHGFKLQREKLEPQRSIKNPNPHPHQAPQPPPPQPPPSPPSPPSITVAEPVVRYRECLKNHAANMGAHVLDGCGEFMPAGEDNTIGALKCAACECHRSFHRREVEGESRLSNQTTFMAPPPRAAGVHLPSSPAVSTHRRLHHPAPPIMMAFGGANGAPAESSSEDFNIFQTYAGVQLMGRTSKKRFRTKFTQEQKKKMFDFAETIGWKIQKQDEQEVLRFCNEVGLKKQVFKVWMHNNKQAAKKK